MRDKILSINTIQSVADVTILGSVWTGVMSGTVRRARRALPASTPAGRALIYGG